MITAGNREAERFCDEAAFWLPRAERALLFPSREVLPFEPLSPEPGIAAARMATLAALAAGAGRPLVVAPLEAVLQYLIPRGKLLLARLDVQRGGDPRVGPLPAPPRAVGLPAGRPGRRAGRVLPARRHRRPLPAGPARAGAHRAVRRRGRLDPRLRRGDPAQHRHPRAGGRPAGARGLSRRRRARGAEKAPRRARGRAGGRRVLARAARGGAPGARALRRRAAALAPDAAGLLRHPPGAPARRVAGSRVPGRQTRRGDRPGPRPRRAAGARGPAAGLRRIRSLARRDQGTRGRAVRPVRPRARMPTASSPSRPRPGAPSSRRGAGPGRARGICRPR